MLLGESMEPVYPQAKKQEVIQQKPFAPPVPNANMHRVFAYLLKTRGLDADQTEAAIKATVKMLNIIEDEYES